MLEETRRRAWHELPETLRDQVEERLGGTVTRFAARPGGFSWGVLGVLTVSNSQEGPFLRRLD
ncbi:MULTISPECIES: hypothetical protein [unclassified Nonomuraea]|uniref:hypothetical protein n=1 Tax=unclassified Nonomuraea TaxID=2593643 RepID=UPI0033DA03EC